MIHRWLASLNPKNPHQSDNHHPPRYAWTQYLKPTRLLFRHCRSNLVSMLIIPFNITFSHCLHALDQIMMVTLLAISMQDVRNLPPPLPAPLAIVASSLILGNAIIHKPLQPLHLPSCRLTRRNFPISEFAGCWCKLVLSAHSFPEILCTPEP